MRETSRSPRSAHQAKAENARWGLAILLACLVFVGGCREAAPEEGDEREIAPVAASAPRARAPRTAASAETVDVQLEPDEDDDDDDEEEEEEEEGGIRLSPEQREEFGIRIGRAGPARIEERLSLPGEVRADPDRIARLMPRFDGLVTELHAREGDLVQSGSLLARIESSESLSSFELRSPIAGRVVERSASRGERIAADQPAFVVADLREVWVDLAVFQSELPRLRVSQPVLIEATSGGPGEARAQIASLSAMIREDTRTATARLILPNPDGEWRPGLFVTGWVTLRVSDAELTVPTDALQRWNGEKIVFVLEGDRLEPRAVETGERDRERVAILSGLRAEEEIAVEGAFLLRSELEKEAFEDDDD